MTAIVRGMLVVAMIAAVAHAEPDVVAAAPPALSYHRLYVRAGWVHISPRSRSQELALSDVHGPASLAVMNGPIAGSGIALDSIDTAAMIAGYVLPVLDGRLSIETLLGAPIHVTFRATGSLADMSIAPYALGIPTGVPALGPTMGEADALPPVVTLVYRIAELGPLHPYAGTGLGLLIGYNARATNPLLTEVSRPELHVDPAAGLVLQTGFDLKLWKSLVARVDIKYIAFMKAHATVDHIEVRTPDLPLFGTAAVGTATMDVWVNPLIVQLGIGADL